MLFLKKESESFLILDKNMYKDDMVSWDFFFFNLVWGLALRKIRRDMFFLFVGNSEKRPCLYYHAFDNQAPPRHTHMHAHTAMACKICELEPGQHEAEFLGAIGSRCISSTEVTWVPTPFQSLLCLATDSTPDTGCHAAIQNVLRPPGYHVPFFMTLLPLIAWVIREDSSPQNKRMEVQWSYHFLSQKGIWKQMFLEPWDLPAVYCMPFSHAGGFLRCWAVTALRPQSLCVCTEMGR